MDTKNITHATAHANTLYVMLTDGTIWFWYDACDRWQREYGSHATRPLDPGTIA